VLGNPGFGELGIGAWEWEILMSLAFWQNYLENSGAGTMPAAHLFLQQLTLVL
jgi:hypothetical protein